MATTMGPVSSPLVIIAAGVWSVDLAAAVGLHLPVTPEPRHVWLTEPGDPLPHELPLTIDFDTGFYFQREGQSLLFGGREKSLEELAPSATHRLPVLADLGIRPGWWGYYEMTPDHNAVIGAAAEPKRPALRHRVLRSRLPAGAGGRASTWPAWRWGWNRRSISARSPWNDSPRPPPARRAM